MVGNVTISRINASDRENYIVIEIQVEGSPLCNAEIQFAEFAKVVTGLSTRPCKIKVPKKIPAAMADQWG